MTELVLHSAFDLTDQVYRGAYAENTLRQYAKHAREWVRFAPQSGFPVDADLWLSYLLRQKEDGKSVSYLRQANAMMKMVHTMRREASPTDTMEAKMLLRSAVRGGTPPRQAQPMRLTDYDLLRGAMKMASTIDIRDLAIIGVMRACMLRRSELCALVPADIEGDLLHIRRSKTDQEGKGAIAYLPAKVQDDLGDWMQEAEIKDGEAIFLSLHKSGKVRALRKPVRTHDMGRIIRAICKRHCTLKQFSTHSMRVGMAMDLVESGAGVIETQLAGRWASPAMPAYYARGMDARNGAIARYWA